MQKHNFKKTVVLRVNGTLTEFDILLLLIVLQIESLVLTYLSRQCFIAQTKDGTLARCRESTLAQVGVDHLDNVPSKSTSMYVTILSNKRVNFDNLNYLLCHVKAVMNFGTQ